MVRGAKRFAKPRCGIPADGQEPVSQAGPTEMPDSAEALTDRDGHRHCLLLPLAVPSGSGAVLAVLAGVKIGPNLSYTGSLATLLWRRVLREHGSEPDRRELTRLGLLTVPAALVLSVLALWAGL
jgi:hypothetical protein